MFLLRKPTDEKIRRFISSEQTRPFSYAAVDATRSETPPTGFKVDHNRTQLGDGETVYTRAVSALRNWQQFELGWIKIMPAGSPIAVGQTVAIRAHTFGLWSLSAARIVYVIEESEPARRFGFAYGTLPDHVECGEERFTIEQLDDGSVWYDIYAFSHPQHALVKLGAALARKLQKQFVKESLEAMRNAAAG